MLRRATASGTSSLRLARTCCRRIILRPQPPPNYISTHTNLLPTALHPSFRVSPYNKLFPPPNLDPHSSPRFPNTMSSRIAVAQMSSTPSIEHNLRQAADLIAQARLANASMLCLPESLDYIVDDPSYAVSLASPLHSSPLLSRYHALASQFGLWLSLGGIHELSHADATRVHNTHLIISPHNVSEPIAVYRKTHLFDAQLPHHHVSEHVNTIPGEKLVVAYDTPLGNIGLSTCYDLRFAALYEALRHAGAHVLLVPSAFFPTTGAAHWHTLLRARAIENQCYVAAAAQAGRHTGSRESYGHAMIVGPFGEVVADAGPEGNGVICAEMDRERLEEVRTRMPVIKHRRDDLLGKVRRI